LFVIQSRGCCGILQRNTDKQGAKNLCEKSGEKQRTKGKGKETEGSVQILLFFILFIFSFFSFFFSSSFSSLSSSSSSFFFFFFFSLMMSLGSIPPASPSLVLFLSQELWNLLWRSLK
jgi:hypothetical protein